MMIPVRCFSCGKPIGHLWEEYKERKEEEEDPKEIMDDLNLDRYCCRRMFTSQKDLIEEINQYSRMGP